MPDWEELIKAGIVILIGVVILSSAGLSGISQEMINSLLNLGKILLLLGIVVFVVTIVLKFRR